MEGACYQEHQTSKNFTKIGQNALHEHWRKGIITCKHTSSHSSNKKSLEPIESFRVFDTGISLKFPKLVYPRSFEMNQKQTYRGQLSTFFCLTDERYTCMYMIIPSLHNLRNSQVPTSLLKEGYYPRLVCYSSPLIK